MALLEFEIDTIQYKQEQQAKKDVRQKDLREKRTVKVTNYLLIFHA
jgi:hypothetical protein